MAAVEAFTYPEHVVQTQMVVFRLLDMQDEMERLLSDLDRAVYLAESEDINADDDKHAAWDKGLRAEAKRRMAEADNAG